ncbi:ATP-dependent DNA helicase [Trichinella spiralis]|uniref:ATP-dependent DNA helicase n=1 Tax=Trichinella spiralis TaxID=6334 RepID=A0ABR3KZP5_TRISP
MCIIAGRWSAARLKAREVEFSMFVNVDDSICILDVYTCSLEHVCRQEKNSALYLGNKLRDYWRNFDRGARKTDLRLVADTD